ncbi:hypothetical protein PV721_27380 [Streptomyces sp. MB09-01]|uniref:hypothetical protein n=1 Tax=Streptomyces sp. MB09-01 TaxID=3028666 RepID=UPI0029B480A3|nr:hypothetical protein [Streptomyces sp. MB09-01]MDX3538005.1 hypothetical protein [Streptomyces sp. MB09-01]
MTCRAVAGRGRHLLDPVDDRPGHDGIGEHDRAGLDQALLAGLALHLDRALAEEREALAGEDPLFRPAGRPDCSSSRATASPRRLAASTASSTVTTPGISAAAL